MPVIGQRCYALRVDADTHWRIMYRVDSDAVVIAEVFAKKTQATPRSVIEVCRRRLVRYDQDARGRGKR